MKRPELNGKRYIALARCSTKGQADTSIEDQLGVILAFARNHEMIHVGNIILDGVTGSVPGARHDIDELIARKTERNDFEVVVVQDTTRLTRSGPRHAASVEYALDCAGIEVVYALDEIPSGDVGDVMKTLLHMSGRQQAKSISMASARGSMSSLQQGRSAHCRRAPYGIDKLYLAADGKPNHIIRNLPDGTQVMLDPKTKTVKQTFRRNEQTGVPSHYNKQKDELVQLVPGDEELVEVVRRIYRLHHVEQLGCPRIARTLNDDGIVSPTGKLWHANTIRSILHNTIYAGVGISNRLSNAIYHERAPESPNPLQVDAKTLSQGKNPPTRTRPRADWHEREEPAVVNLLDPEIKTMATEKQERYLENIAAGRQPDANKDRHRDSPYLLKGILTSRQGGHRMTGRPSGRKPYRKRYYAISRAFSAPKSSDAVLRKLIPAEPLEECVVAVVREMLLRASDIQGRIRDAIRKEHRQSVKGNAEVEALRKDYASLTRKIEFAMEELDDVSPDVVKGKIKKWEAKRRSIAGRVCQVQPVVALKAKDVETAANEIIERIAELGRSMDDLPNVALRRLIETVVHRAVVDLETRSVKLELRLPSWMMDSSKPMCLDATFGCKYDIETHHENGVQLLKMQICWFGKRLGYGGIDFADAA